VTRWLGETGKKIKKLILVAPAIVNKRKEYWELEKFYDFKINFGIKERVEEIILIESDNDGEGILESGKIYSRELKVKPIILHKRGHFTERGMGTREFPELLEKIIE
jgi:predicted alpha/beta hydrolase family esterase